MFIQLHSRKRRTSRRPVIFGIIALLCSLTVTVLFTSLIIRGCAKEPAGVLPEDVPVEVVVNPWENLTFPTPQTNLLAEGVEGVFQPTVSGRPESAFYGSTRTGTEGGRLVTRFHEGIDIAPLFPFVKGKAQDPVFAVADGRVGYVNTGAGRSNYGKYVVILHKDPMGEVYTIYSHLAEVEAGLRDGMKVEAGAKLGLMGNTPANIIPNDRSHLHFEAGLILNSRYVRIAAEGKRAPIHGNFNGGNLCGLDPLEFFRFMNANPGSSFADFVKSVPVAMELVVRISNIPDFFKRYPALWEGAPPGDGAIRVYVSENGLPLRGHAESEIRAPARGRAVVARVYEEVLGKNGKHLVTQKGGEWIMTPKGDQWLALVVK